MRRVLIVSIAILVVAFATTAVRAGEQQVSDRLLEILKERQIISESEYSELSDLADEMQADQSKADQRLEALDASITEYLAKEGDGAGTNVHHKVAKGFGFEAGNFSLFVGGLFQFEYFGIDRKDAQDTNNFRVQRARLSFAGKAFVEGLTYKFQFEASRSAVFLLDAYGNYDIANGIQIRMGQFKIPYSRQELTSAGALAFMNRSIVVDAFAPGRDIGVQAHDNIEMGDGGMTLEYAFGLFNGDGINVGGNDNNWFGWCARLGFYPMGMVDYSEGDFDASDFTFGVAGSYYSVRNRPQGTTVKRDQWEIDLVFKVAGFYIEGEYHSVKINPDGSSSADHDGWFIQAGFFIPNSDFEIIARYSMINWDEDSTGLKNSKEWVVGAAWYPGGFNHPLKVVIQFGEFKSDSSNKRGSSPFSGTEDYDIDVSEFVTYLERTRFLRIGVQIDW